MKKNFMLIDDCEIELFINQKYIEKGVVDSKIKSFKRAKEALDYLSSYNDKSSREDFFFPDIILLDLSMPEMNGFQFLKKFSELENSKLKSINIYILSYSINFNEISVFEQQNLCQGFINKPLSSQKIEQIIKQIANELSVQ
tara:strand:+ start:9116 stop:9541 length:426 start_codon:yes stop_codon:yes gene_type:complete